MAQPQTETRTDHGLSIRANGVDIGRIQTWAPSQSRAVRHEYEINSITAGGVYENIPSVASNLVINVSRYDLYREKFEQVWGLGFDLDMLTDQTNPFQVWERWEIPVEIESDEPISFLPRKGPFGGNLLRKALGGRNKEPGILKEMYIYSGCWFENIGRTHAVEGNRIVSVDATIRYIRKYKAA